MNYPNITPPTSPGEPLADDVIHTLPALEELGKDFEKLEEDEVKVRKILARIRNHIFAFAAVVIVPTVVGIAQDVRVNLHTSDIRAAEQAAGRPDPLMLCQQHLWERVAKLQLPIRTETVLSSSVGEVGCEITLNPTSFMPTGGSH